MGAPATPAPSDATWFRRVLGQYPTGVVVVTAIGPEDKPVGMAVGSFTSVSLDPPLVAFLPDKSSTSWPKIRTSGRFCANILSAHQEPVCRAFASKLPDKFQGLGWRPAGSGSPILDDVVTWIDCDIDAIQDAGDHYIVIGRVRELNIENPGLPLLFFQGGYGRFTPLSLAAADADLVDQLRLVDVSRREMEALAAEFDVECIASALVEDELVLVASAGKPRTGELPTRVGQRLPFVPPLGTLWAAWSDDSIINAWLRGLGPHAAPEDVDVCRQMLQRVRSRGYSVGVGVAGHAELERALADQSARLDHGAVEVVRRFIAKLGPQYEATELEPGGSYDVRAIAAPVFGPDGRVALVLSLYGLPERSSTAEVEAYAARLVNSASSVSGAVTGAMRIASAQR